MREIRRLAVVVCLVALGYGLYGLFVPVGTEPRLGLSGASIPIPGTSGAKVSCGSVVQPQTLTTGTVQNYLNDLKLVAVGQDCPRALHTQLRTSGKWCGGALLALLLSLLILRPAKAHRAQENYDQYAGAQSTPRSRVDSRLREDGRSASARGSRISPQRWPAAAALALIVMATVAYLIVRSNGESSVTGLGIGGSGAAAVAEHTCAATAVARDAQLLRDAVAASASDVKGASLNVDGDGAYAMYAQELSAMDVASCSASFQQVYSSWARDWKNYGEYEVEATKPHAPWNSTWSVTSVKARRAALLGTLRQDDADLSAAARASGVEVPPRSWPTV